MTIEAVFFDSGHTLMRPIGNRWFPGVRFFELCRAFGRPVPDDAALAAACDVGYAWLDAHHHEAPDERAEERQFAGYYHVLFSELGVAPPAGLVDALARSWVADSSFEPYPATRSTLEAIGARRLPMAVLTDGWPSTRSKFRALGFLQYFDAFVISAEVGCTKPARGMFDPALRALGVEPSGVLFVDDAPDLVEAARDLGFTARLMDVENRHPQITDRLTSLEQVLACLD